MSWERDLMSWERDKKKFTCPLSAAVRSFLIIINFLTDHFKVELLLWILFVLCYLCFVFVFAILFCLFVAALWPPAENRLTS